MKRFLQLIWQTQDWPAVGFLTLISAVAIWCMLLPMMPNLQTATMQRFHLTTAGYFSWACQQPIPAMYNMENRYWITEAPLLIDNFSAVPEASIEVGLIDSGFANHFPTRVFTFGDCRHKYFSDLDKPVYLLVESRYRGRCLRTVFQAFPVRQGGFKLLRMKPESETGHREKRLDSLRLIDKDLS